MIGKIISGEKVCFPSEKHPKAVSENLRYLIGMSPCATSQQATRHPKSLLKGGILWMNLSINSGSGATNERIKSALVLANKLASMAKVDGIFGS
jgi:hypothetical protein